MAPYSGRNKIPTVQKLGEELAQRLSLQKLDASKLGNKSPEELEKIRAASRRKVIDPTTKHEVIIQDVDGDFEDAIRHPRTTVPKVNVDPDRPPVPNDLPGVPSPHLPEGKGNQYRQTLDDLAPPEANPEKTEEHLHKSRKRDVIYYPTPIADLKASFYALETAINQVTMVCTGGIVALNWLFVGGGFKGLLASLIAGLVVSVGLHLWLRRIQEDANSLNWDAERKRASAATESLVPESAEWMNSMVGIIWKLVNAEMFASMADTLEDVMQASVPPALIQNVRVAEIGQGDVPFKLLSLRALPSADEDLAANRKGPDLSEEEKAKKKEQRELEGEDDPKNKYYNLEASFAYHAIPAKGVIGKAKNLHLQIVFYLGMRGLFGVPLPIFIELKGIVGTIRIRFQLTPDPPFLRNVTFTFMGLPKIEVSAVPMSAHAPNVLNLPLISGFVNSSIAAAIDEYVAPKSLIMDMSKLLEGDSVKKDTDAMGLIYIKIKNASGIKAQDRNGTSDPFITIAFANGKPQYTTRIIEKDLNPIWNEQTCLLIYQDQLTAGEKLSLELWDSDMIGSDDVVGKIQFDLRDLIKEHKNDTLHRSDTLKDADDKEMPGKLNWEIGYYSLASFKKSMKTKGEDLSLPEAIRHREEFKDPVGSLDNEHEALVVSTPPDPSLPSGIASLLLQQIENLELNRVTGTFRGHHDWTPAQLTGENTDEDGEKLPSTYCTIMLNDELVFKTRTKVKSSTPIFNAQTERYIRDWRNAVFTVTCRQARYREHDPIVGCVVLKLSDVLLSASQVTAVYSLDGGIGYGRITLSLLFRSVPLTLPRSMLGWDVGSIEVLGEAIRVDSDSLAGCRLSMRTDVGSGRVRRAWSNGREWRLQGHRVLIAVKKRYQASLFIEFRTKNNKNPVAYSVYWLTDINDNEETHLKLPIWRTSDVGRLKQNYISNMSDNQIKAEKVGTLDITIRFKTGLDESHYHYIAGNDMRESFETWECTVAEGYRKRIVKRETSSAVKDLVKEGKVNGPNATDPDDESEDEHVSSNDRKRFQQDKQGQAVDRETDDYEDNERNRNFAKMFGDELASFSPKGSSKQSDDIVSDDESDLGVLEDITDSDSDLDDDPDARKRRQKQDAKAQKHELQRKHRGKMHLGPLRSLLFLKDEAKVGARQLKNKFSKHARQPDVETELGT